jgi:hypothetical protein
MNEGERPPLRAAAKQPRAAAKQATAAASQATTMAKQARTAASQDRARRLADQWGGDTSTTVQGACSLT